MSVLVFGAVTMPPQVSHVPSSYVRRVHLCVRCVRVVVFCFVFVLVVEGVVSFGVRCRRNVSASTSCGVILGQACPHWRSWSACGRGVCSGYRCRHFASQSESCAVLSGLRWQTLGSMLHFCCWFRSLCVSVTLPQKMSHVPVFVVPCVPVIFARVVLVAVTLPQ